MDNKGKQNTPANDKAGWLNKLNNLKNKFFSSSSPVPADIQQHLDTALAFPYPSASLLLSTKPPLESQVILKDLHSQPTLLLPLWNQLTDILENPKLTDQKAWPATCLSAMIMGQWADQNPELWGILGKMDQTGHPALQARSRHLAGLALCYLPARSSTVAGQAAAGLPSSESPAAKQINAEQLNAESTGSTHPAFPHESGMPKSILSVAKQTIDWLAAPPASDQLPVLSMGYKSLTHPSKATDFAPHLQPVALMALDRLIQQTSGLDKQKPAAQIAFDLLQQGTQERIATKKYVKQALWNNLSDPQINRRLVMSQLINHWLSYHPQHAKTLLAPLLQQAHNALAPTSQAIDSAQSAALILCSLATTGSISHAQPVLTALSHPQSSPNIRLACAQALTTIKSIKPQNLGPGTVIPSLIPNQNQLNKQLANLQENACKNASDKVHASIAIDMLEAIAMADPTKLPQIVPYLARSANGVDYTISTKAAFTLHKLGEIWGSETHRILSPFLNSLAVEATGQINTHNVAWPRSTLTAMAKFWPHAPQDMFWPLCQLVHDGSRDAVSILSDIIHNKPLLAEQAIHSIGHVLPWVSKDHQRAICASINIQQPSNRQTAPLQHTVIQRSQAASCLATIAITNPAACQTILNILHEQISNTSIQLDVLAICQTLATHKADAILPLLPDLFAIVQGNNGPHAMKAAHTITAIGLSDLNNERLILSSTLQSINRQGNPDALAYIIAALAQRLPSQNKPTLVSSTGIVYALTQPFQNGRWALGHQNLSPEQRNSMLVMGALCKRWMDPVADHAMNCIHQLTTSTDVRAKRHAGWSITLLTDFLTAEQLKSLDDVLLTRLSYQAKRQLPAEECRLETRLLSIIEKGNRTGADLPLMAQAALSLTQLYRQRNKPVTPLEELQEQAIGRLVSSINQAQKSKYATTNTNKGRNSVEFDTHILYQIGALGYAMPSEIVTNTGCLRELDRYAKTVEMGTELQQRAREIAAFIRSRPDWNIRGYLPPSPNGR